MCLDLIGESQIDISFDLCFEMSYFLTIVLPSQMGNCCDDIIVRSRLINLLQLPHCFLRIYYCVLSLTFDILLISLTL